MGLIFEALFALVVLLCTIAGLAFTVYKLFLNSLPGYGKQADIERVSKTARAVQDIMCEKVAESRLALCLKHSGLQIRIHRNGYLVAKVPDAQAFILSPLTDARTMDGVSGVSKRFPVSGIWISFVNRETLLADLPLHPVAILNSMLEAASFMPYETNDAAKPLMLALTADNSALMLHLHTPITALSLREKEKLMNTINRKGFNVGEGDVAASLTVADLLDRADNR